MISMKSSVVRHSASIGISRNSVRSVVALSRFAYRRMGTRTPSRTANTVAAMEPAISQAVSELWKMGASRHWSKSNTGCTVPRSRDRRCRTWSYALVGAVLRSSSECGHAARGRVISPMDVGLEVRDGALLLHDHGAHQVADRKYTDHAFPRDHRQVPDALVGHEPHAIVRILLRCHGDDPGSHDLRDARLGGRAS